MECASAGTGNKRQAGLFAYAHFYVRIELPGSLPSLTETQIQITHKETPMGIGSVGRYAWDAKVTMDLLSTDVKGKDWPIIINQSRLHRLMHGK